MTDLLDQCDHRTVY